MAVVRAYTTARGRSSASSSRRSVAIRPVAAVATYSAARGDTPSSVPVSPVRRARRAYRSINCSRAGVTSAASTTRAPSFGSSPSSVSRGWASDVPRIGSSQANTTPRTPAGLSTDVCTSASSAAGAPVTTCAAPIFSSRAARGPDVAAMTRTARSLTAATTAEAAAAAPSASAVTMSSWASVAAGSIRSTSVAST